MSICPSCQERNPDSHQFCQFCGTKIPTDISLNILGEEAMRPSAAITSPLNLESILGDLKIQVENFTSSQVAGDTENSQKELDEELALEEFPLQLNPENSPETFSAVSPKMPIGSSSQMHLADVIYAGKTDIGMQRNSNEDDFVTIFQAMHTDGKSKIGGRSHRGVFILCDGMGGHEGGEEASAIAVNSISDQFQPFWLGTLPGKKKLNEIICNANQAIFIKNEDENRHSLGRMGTTLVMMAIHDLEVAIAHVGDSRIYKVTNNPKPQIGNLEDVSGYNTPRLEQITRDHEVLNQLIDLGVDLQTAIARPDAHQLTQALGPSPSNLLAPTIEFFSLSEPTLFLLCSDGLCDNDAIEENWQTHLLPILNKEVDIQTGLENLIELGNNVNGHDNLTAILVLCI